MKNKYEEISDELEYGDISDEKAINICNNLLKKSLTENDDVVLESIFNAVFNGVDNREIASKLYLEDVVKNILNYNEECLDYLISILAYTGKEEYRDVLIKLKSSDYDLDIDEALNELDYRIHKNK